MKRFDRATYLLFLLVLLADVALAHSVAQTGGDTSGGLIFRAGGQLQVNPAGEALRSATSSSLRVVGRKRTRMSFATWSGNLFHVSSRLGHSLQSAPVMLSVLASAPEVCSGPALVASCRPLSPSLGIFEHSGSPAP
ncbi:hypothetical protein [Acidicapsa ligni]|uniref:hypothetical protein n=1 Tax=Acidicapsa ligni TaxID=542300 RepID=UPI0021DFBC02|nr:hypothetical protein [Acidicapsa ligni]